MKRILIPVLALIMAVTTATALFAPVQAQSSPPSNPDATWQPPDEGTESIAPSVGVEAYNQSYPGLQLSPSPAVPLGAPGSIVNAYLVNSSGRILSVLNGRDTCYLIVSVNGPGNLYVWEYYPAGSQPYGHWLVYRWSRPTAGIWRIGPFQADAWDTNGRYVWKIWYSSAGSFSTRSLSFTYSRGYYIPDPPPQPAYPPAINSFSSDLTSIDTGQTATLSWTTSNATSVSITGVGSVGTSGSTTVSPNGTTTYVLTANGNTGSPASSSLTISVKPRVPPTFTSDQTGIQSGQSATLSWNAPSATSVTVSGVGTFSASGSTLVTPDRTTMYTLTANYADGSSQTAYATVNVEQPPYILYGLIGLLAIGAIVITILLATRPKPAAAAHTSAGAASTVAATSSQQGTAVLSDPASTRAMEAVPAKLIMPDGSELLLAGNNRPFGREDFDKFLAPDARAFISRQHVNIWYEGDHYYIEDRSSTNGTRLNGSDIKGTGRHALQDGDTVDLASKLNITFKL